MIKYFLIFIFALVIGLIGIKLFGKLKILDKPGPDIVPPRKPVPTIQGFFLIIGFILSILIFYPQYFFRKEFLGLLFGGLIIGLISIVDNFKGLSPKLRLVVQFVVALIAFFFGGVGLHSFIGFSGVEIDFPIIISLILTIIWILGFINAVNWFDGINSLASGVSTVGFLTIFLLIKYVVLGYYTGISEQAILSLNMVADISFVLFIFSIVYTYIEFKPFGLLRDVGVMFYGYSLAYLSLMGGAKIGIMLVVLSLVIFDAIWVVFNRIFKMKKNPLKGDYTHLHYRLLALKWSRSEVRFFIWGYSLFLMVLMIIQGVNRYNKLIIFILMFLIFFGLNYYIFWHKKIPYEYMDSKKKK